jgi:hypothetical protein
MVYSFLLHMQFQSTTMACLLLRLSKVKNLSSVAVHINNNTLKGALVLQMFFHGNGEPVTVQRERIGSLSRTFYSQMIPWFFVELKLARLGTLGLYLFALKWSQVSRLICLILLWFWLVLWVMWISLLGYWDVVPILCP